MTRSGSGTVSPGDESDPNDATVRQMGEGAVVLLAAASWFGAWIAAPVPLAPAALAVLVSLCARRPLLFIAATALLASGLGHRSVAAFTAVPAAHLSAAEVSVVDDPRPRGIGWQATVRLSDGRRVQASAFGSPGFRLGQASVGDRLRVDGRLEPLDDSSWARAGHLVGRLEISEVRSRAGPAGPRALVERLRAVVVAGAEPLPEADRALYLGLVVGEDRFQAPDQRARFAAAGLAHLLAVSGQNVAFVLAVLRPISQLLTVRARFALTVLVLIFFATATRLEPSVLRATVTAGLAATAGLSGRRQSGVRLLGLAITGLVLIDPFLVYSVGFQLSVAASGGILLLAPVLDSRLPGPRVLVGPLAVTAGAQVAVLPLLSARFGPVSAISVPANLLAGWAAGLVMMWGLTLGVVAGMIGGFVGSWIQAVPLLALRWLDGVASLAVDVPAPLLDTTALLVVALLLLVYWVTNPRRLTTDDMVGPDREMSLAPVQCSSLVAIRRFVGLVVLSLVMALLVARVPHTPRTPISLQGGGFWIPAAAGFPSVLVIDAGADRRLLDALLANRISESDLIVVESGAGGGVPVARAVMNLVESEAVLAPPQHRLIGARRVTEATSIPTARLELSLEPDGNRLRVGW